MPFLIIEYPGKIPHGQWMAPKTQVLVDGPMPEDILTEFKFTPCEGYAGAVAEKKDVPSCALLLSALVDKQGPSSFCKAIMFALNNSAPHFHTAFSWIFMRACHVMSRVLLSQGGSSWDGPLLALKKSQGRIPSNTCCRRMRMRRE